MPVGSYGEEYEHRGGARSEFGKHAAMHEFRIEPAEGAAWRAD